MEKVKMPIDVVLALTYKCNSRCAMCDIWKMKPFEELEAEYYGRLPKSLRYINVSGGEPFLRPDIIKVIKILKQSCPKADIIISTNGLATELVISKMKEILKIDPRIGVAISIDGIGKMHDEIRGIPGAFEKSMQTVKKLKDLGMNNLRLAFTISKKNAEELSKVYDLANDLGVQFTLALAQSSEFFFGGKKITEAPEQKKLKEQFDYLIGKELNKNNPMS